MCDPAHSIVQIKDRLDDDDEPPMGTYQMDPESRIKVVLGKMTDWGRKIKDWFHFSRFGVGHDAALAVSGNKWNLLPVTTKYEGEWWDRTFRIDGSYRGFQDEKDSAFEVARVYHQETVMRNMATFRQFLEQSIKRSHAYAPVYVETFLEKVLTRVGRDQALRKFRQIFGKTATVYRCFCVVAAEEKAQATKVLMGFTRKRKLFLPHWADDDKLWTPG